jgi:hypothetical protein
MKVLLALAVMFIFGYMIGNSYPATNLPLKVRQFLGVGTPPPPPTPVPAPVVEIRPAPTPPGAWLHDPNHKGTLDAPAYPARFNGGS